MRRADATRAAQAGFSLIEVLLGVALTLGIALATLGVVHRFTNALATTYSSLGGAAAVDERIADMRSQSATALSVFVPTRDVKGRPNAALGAVGHEVDFYSKAGTNAPIYWAYYYDAAAQKLERYDYDAAGNAGVRVRGKIDTKAAYPPISGVTLFTAQGLMATQLAAPDNPYASAFSPSAASAIHDLPVSLDNDAESRPDNFAGNTVVQVHVQTTGADRYVHLAAGEFPTGFTFQGSTKYHVIEWREDTTHRFLFGFGQRSRVFVYADVDVTYDNWKHYQIWCHKVPIYGQPDGIEEPDSNHYGDYIASRAQNTGNYALGVCINGQGLPGSNGYYAAHGAPPAPDPHASFYPRSSVIGG